MGALDTLFEWCVRDLSSERTRTEFDWARAARPALRALASPWEVIELLDRRTSGPPDSALYEQRDRVVLALLEHHQQAPGSRVTRSLLIMVFAPTLRGLRRRFCASKENEEIEDQLVEGLLDAAAAYPVERRRSKVALNFAKEIEARLCDRFRAEQRLQDAVTEAATEIAPRAEEIEARETFDLAEEMRPKRGGGLDEDDLVDAEQVLAGLVTHGALADVEKHLLLGAHVYGRELKTWIASAPPELGGMKYDAAKKRLQRALQGLKEYLESKGLRLVDFLEEKK